MKTRKNLLFALTCTGLLAMPVVAQTFTNLHTFTGTSDGSSPFPGGLMILSGNTLYGTAAAGGTNGNGTVFAVNTDGTGFTNLHNFTYGSDGAEPSGGLVLSGNTLYGTAAAGGTNGNGTVFAVNIDGTGFTNLYNFTKAAEENGSPLLITNSDGIGPESGLILSGNTLYGTAYAGGTNGSGTVFAINTNGTGFMNLHSFTAPPVNHQTNSDGANPQAGLVLSGNTLYGTAYVGGTNGNGTVFRVNTDGTGFTNLHNFATLVLQTNSDGANPLAGFILSDSALYGTTIAGGTNGVGTVFRVNTDGTGFATLHNFLPFGGSDGGQPRAGLVLLGNTLYGTASYGGSGNSGTVFAVNTNGTGFAILYSFTEAVMVGDSGNYTNSDGYRPEAGLLLSGNTLYGTTFEGGTNSDGTVFSLSFPSPQLTIIGSRTNANLTWPSGVAGFSYSSYTLQQNNNLAASAGWSTSGYSINTASGTNSITITSPTGNLFFRLKQ